MCSTVAGWEPGTTSGTSVLTCAGADSAKLSPTVSGHRMFVCIGNHPPGAPNSIVTAIGESDYIVRESRRERQTPRYSRRDLTQRPSGQRGVGLNPSYYTVAFAVPGGSLARCNRFHRLP